MAKENEENENEISFEVVEMENVSCTCVGGYSRLDSKPIKYVDTGLKLELQGDVENQAETLIYVGFKLICPRLKLDLLRLQI